MSIPVYNETDTPVGPLHFGHLEIVFQPDQDKNPGTFAWEYAPKKPPLDEKTMEPIMSTKAWQEKLRLDQIPEFRGGGRWVKVSSEPLPTNIVDLPDDFSVWLKENGGACSKIKGFDKLIIGENLRNRLQEETKALKAEKARLERERLELVAAMELQKAELQKQLLEAKAEVKVANTRVVK